MSLWDHINLVSEFPPKLDKKLREYAAKSGTTKTEVMVAASANYLGCVSEVLLNQRVVELEERLANVEAKVGIK